MHVPCFTADERFVNFDFACEHPARKIILHRKTNPVQHKPGRLLCDAQRPVNLPRANSVSTIRD